MMKAFHSVQPLQLDENGVLRFKPNPIVVWLLEQGSLNMNDIASNEAFSREDREHFAQLIGYSFDGASSLSYMSSEVLDAAKDAYSNPEMSQAALVQSLRGRLEDLKQALKGPMAELYGIHPDDLG